MDWFDGSLYPDEDPPENFDQLGDRIDFIARLCGAWDFGILPEWVTIQEMRQASWRDAVEQCNLLTSPTYHLLREWHGLSPAPFLGSIPAYIRDDPNLAFV